MIDLEILAQLQTEFPACLAAGLADISSGIVLCVSTAEKYPQERLDAICAIGAELLDGPTAHLFSQALQVTDASAFQEIVVVSLPETLLIFRSPQDPAETMFCICAADIDIDRFLASARSGLNRAKAAQ